MNSIYIQVKAFIMRDRIKTIIEREDLTPTKLAEKLNISRAVISHILNGRNNPSLDVVTSILTEMPYISSDWLLSGEGEMYRDGYDSNNSGVNTGLFVDNQDEIVGKNYLGHTNKVNNDSESTNSIVNQMGMPIIESAKKITQIIIYYDDNTFESFVINKGKAQQQ